MDHLRVGDSRGFRDIEDRASRDRRGVVEIALEHRKDRGDSSRPMEREHRVRSPGLHVADMRGLLGDGIESLKFEGDLRLPGDGHQVEHSV